MNPPVAFVPDSNRVVFQNMSSTGVKGRDGNEKRRWEALEVHHNMVQAITEKSGKKRKTRNQVADVSQLPRITQVYTSGMNFDHFMTCWPPPPPLPSFPCRPLRLDPALPLTPLLF